MIELIFIIIILSISSFGLIKLIDFSFNEGNVLDWYYMLILKLEDKYPKLFKVLGGCLICFGFWFYNFIYFFIIANLISLSPLYYIIYIGLSILLTIDEFS